MAKEATCYKIVNFIVIFASLVVLADASDRKLHAYNDHLLDNYIFDDTSFLKEIAETENNIKCSILCQNVIYCVSFYYSENEEKCRLHNTRLYTSDNGVATEGWKYFVHSDTNCPVNDGFVHIRSSKVCIQMSPTRYNNSIAHEYCSNKSSKMITLETTTKRNAFNDLLGTVLKKRATGWVFIGLTKVGNVWTWNDGNQLGLEALWQSGQPYCVDSSCLCVIAYESSNWAWNDNSCAAKAQVVCEIP